MSFKLTIGRTAVLTEPMYTNEAIAGFVVSAEIDSSYLRHSLDHYGYSVFADNAVKGATLNKAKLRGLPLLVPPLSEQRAIAAILDAIDEAIERTEAVIAATEALRKSLLHELLTRGIPGRHSEWKDVLGLGTIPACWDVVRLGDLLVEIEVGHSPQCESRPARPDEWGVLKVSSISWGEFLPDENKALPSSETANPALEVRTGDLLVSRANTPELVGKAVLVRQTRPRLLLCDKTLRLVPITAIATSSLISLLLGAPSARRQISGAAAGSSRSMYNISQESLKAVRLPLPPALERGKITDIVNLLDGSARAHREAHRALIATKASAADALLTGRVRVPEAAELRA